jgi:hypothetical protein
MRNIVPTQEVWFVSGCEEGHTLFETKLDAEIYARKLFPDKDEQAIRTCFPSEPRLRTYLFQNCL